MRRGVGMQPGAHRMATMDTIAALLLIAFHLFFGCHGGEPGRSPPPAAPEAASSR